jgi:hypothetical protein
MNHLYSTIREAHIHEQDELVLFLQSNITNPAEKFFLFIPFAAPGGTAEGSQRLYTELAFHFCKQGYNAVLMDLPPYGESCFKNETEPGNEFDMYRKFINSAVNWVHSKYQNPQLVICAMCFAALPAVQFAAGSLVKHVILLSPHNYAAEWPQLPENIQAEITSVRPVLLKRTSPLNILVIQGEKDKQHEEVAHFLREHTEAGNKVSTTFCLVEQANYTFNGWPFKEAIFKNIHDWIKNDTA